MTKRAEDKHSHQDGTSWAVEIGSEKNFCPIVVKDLDQPRHMLIEVCSLLYKMQDHRVP